MQKTIKQKNMSNFYKILHIFIYIHIFNLKSFKKIKRSKKKDNHKKNK